MKILVQHIPASLTSQQVEELLHSLSSWGADWRCKQALKYKHLFGQYACLQSFAMLHALIDCAEPFEYNSFGKPFWPHRQAFSISHCRTAIAVAVDASPIGVDIESLRQVDEALIRRTMNSQEQAQIAAAVHPQEAFIALWTKKEALLKYYGTGIVDDLHAVLNNIPAHVRIDTSFHTEQGYILSVAHEP